MQVVTLSGPPIGGVAIHAAGAQDDFASLIE
jgi:hypothetical protein